MYFEAQVWWLILDMYMYIFIFFNHKTKKECIHISFDLYMYFAFSLWEIKKVKAVCIPYHSLLIEM